MTGEVGTMAVLGGSVVLLVGTVMAGLWLDAREVRRKDRRNKRARPLVPDFTKVVR
jgi:hypothetical protein